MARAHATVLAPAPSVPCAARFYKRWRNSDSAAANWLVFFASAPFGTQAVHKHVAGLLLAHPHETTASISKVSFYTAPLHTINRRRQIRIFG
jgi:hypothetical protein